MGETKTMVTLENRQERSEECSERANFYRYLGRLYYKELDDELISRLAEGQSILAVSNDMDEDEQDFARGFNKMTKYVKHKTPDTLTESRCDYARVFLGAGTACKDPVSPYESVYTGEERLLMQGARDEMLVSLASEGLAIEDSFNMPEDHISFQLQYMARLLDQESESWQEGCLERAVAANEKSERFFNGHLMNWVPTFCREATAMARTSFYRGLCECTDAWMRLESRSYDKASGDRDEERSEDGDR